ncbi:MAG: phenylalanine--tRNA ligase subunit beta [Candidatus Dasytiphilus stammeri]
MKLSEAWLREWVNPDIDTETLAEQLTLSGLAVENVITVTGNYCAKEDVVVGEIIECKPVTRHLFTTRVHIGIERVLTIVCGAENCRKGLKVAVSHRSNQAMNSENCSLQDQKFHPRLTITSEGKLCSFTDLGLTDNDLHNNYIIELPNSAPLGMNIRDYLQLDDDKTIEINVPPNRSDCLSICGIAREIAVINKLKLKERIITFQKIRVEDILPIRVEVAEACPRYLARLLKDINVNVPTPFWMREKLRRCDIISDNIVMDIHNYILIELGQPIQVYDRKIIDGSIIVRMAKSDERVVLTNGYPAKLQSNTLVVSDNNQVLSLAGIIGSQRSMVHSKTTDILLESAFYSPEFIIGRAGHYGLHTPDSHRSERGIDPLIQYKAIEMATELFHNICGGQAGPLIDVTNPILVPKGRSIILRRKKIDILLGYHINDDEVVDLLSRLGCLLTDNESGWNVKTPSWRFDLRIEEDIVEEIARVYGYNNIPSKSLKTSLIFNRSKYPHKISLNRIRNLLVDRGYQEVITYSFVDPKIQSLLHPGRRVLKLLNPISGEMSAMRLSLWSSLLSVLIYNQNRQQKCIRIFEIGNRFITNQENLLKEDLMITGVLSGKKYEEHWDMPVRLVDFYDLKGDVEALLDLTGKTDINFQSEIHPALHPGQSAAIYLQHKRIGIIGVINPLVEQQLGIKNRTVIFELLCKRVTDPNCPIIQEISKFPSNRRDIAIVVSEHIPAFEIINECKKVLSNQSITLNLFDVYRGFGIPKGYKSIALSVILQDHHRTLKEDEVSAIISKCLEALKMRFQATLRS